jgi:hypothetical protein
MVADRLDYFIFTVCVGCIGFVAVLLPYFFNFREIASPLAKNNEKTNEKTEEPDSDEDISETDMVKSLSLKKINKKPAKYDVNVTHSLADSS